MVEKKSKKVSKKNPKSELKKKDKKISEKIADDITNKIAENITKELAKEIKKKRAADRKALSAKLGRPSKYQPRYAIDLVEFFSRDYWTIDEVEKTNPMTGVNYKVKIKRPSDFPTFERFAAEILVDQDTLSNWANAKDDEGNLIHPDFFGAYKVAKAKQKDFLIYHGLAGSYNGSFAIFTAKNVTDMRDKQEMEHSGAVSLGIATISKVIQDQQAKVLEIKEADFADFEAITPANTGEFSKGDS